MNMATARVFKSGNSQAVRLPKKFRVKSAEVRYSGAGTKSCCARRAGGWSGCWTCCPKCQRICFRRSGRIRGLSHARVCDECALYAGHERPSQCIGRGSAVATKGWKHRLKPVLLGGFGFFYQGFLADDDNDAGVGDVEAAAVGFQVVADFGAFGKADVAVNDG